MRLANLLHDPKSCGVGNEDQPLAHSGKHRSLLELPIVPWAPVADFCQFIVKEAESPNSVSHSPGLGDAHLLLLVFPRSSPGA